MRVISKFIKNIKGDISQISRTVMWFLINHIFVGKHDTTTPTTSNQRSDYKTAGWLQNKKLTSPVRLHKGMWLYFEEDIFLTTLQFTYRKKFSREWHFGYFTRMDICGWGLPKIFCNQFSRSLLAERLFKNKFVAFRKNKDAILVCCMNDSRSVNTVRKLIYFSVLFNGLFCNVIIENCLGYYLLRS